ncbi:4,5:9,10-diseco-3-hydroxy-5,9,17-trioxoandrosta-1(10),2-diene-4-oate hydrolase [Leifsonia psychrotolerans]|uniref:4,5:9,10-diseco-3-hydroxy-5,9, 17-trioxoandrosta-1(10),2-diene-4-oate hydrolase n=1 Tax=Glaciibacter psychrotolerans TaxID=670054 RepID=A0A7Z0EGP3_9MICO|nr:4,5:9,10-diseco-3-hydroxy-5,9,17-trioxoandrosta-1(10),2-diene-4-oate hydrolase [Leifsonia psychrotolerans]
MGDITFSYHEAGQGEPLLMLHGSGPGVSAWSNFQHNLPVFAENFRVIMPDLPGFGRTDLPEINDVYPRFAARLVAQFMHELGIDSCLIIGNSMGGSVAAELAAMEPSRVRRLALMGPGGLAVSVFGTDPSEGALRLFEFLDDPTRERMVAWVTTMVSDPATITEELIDERMANALADGAIERSRAIFASVFEPAFTAAHQPLWSRAEQIPMPTLMIWGRDDRMLPFDQAHFANRRLPDVELHTFSRCGHWAQIERKRDFERVVTEFFTR